MSTSTRVVRDAAGFRPSDVGEIPADWDVVTLATQLHSGPKNGYSGRSGKDARGTPTLMLSATTSGRMILNEATTKRLNETLEANSGVLLQPGDVLVQRSNTIDLVGTTAIYNGPSGAFAYPDLMMRLRFKHNCTAQWFWRYANSQNGRRYFMAVAAGSTGSMPKLSGAILRKMPLPLPPLPEQAIVAEALNDADDSIESLEQLIAKKRQIKQGAMQELLTGNRRLPGFSGQWELKRLGELGEALIGLTYTPSEVRESGVLVLRSSNVAGGTLAFQDNVFVETTIPERLFVRSGDILICARNGSRDLIGKCALIDHRANGMTFGAFMAIFRTTYSAFVYQYFQSDHLKRQIHEHLGATINQITNKSLNAFEIVFPKEEREQAAIASVLLEMDTEIEQLTRKLCKARQLKQAMMQELLSGRVRLV